MADSSNNSRCDWYFSAGNIANIIYYTEIPVVFVFGIIGQSLLLVSMIHQAKKESACSYQIFLTISEIAVIITRTFMAVTYYWLSGFDGSGVPWFRSCYACMWVSARLAIPLENMLVTTSLFLAIAMSADRIFALGKPFVYKNINYRRHQAIACTICMLIGVSTSIFAIFQYYPETGENGIYTILPDDDFIQSMTAAVLDHARDIVRAIGTITLVCCDAAMIVLYRNYMKKVETIASSSEVKKRRKMQKILVVLALSESICNLVSMSSFILFYTMAYSYSNFYVCEYFLVTPLTDILIDVSAAADCFVAFAVSKAVRQSVYEAVPCLRRFASSTTGN